MPTPSLKLNQIGASPNHRTPSNWPQSGYNSIIAHRSGETEHLHRDLASPPRRPDQNGSPARTDRIAKIINCCA